MDNDLHCGNISLQEDAHNSLFYSTVFGHSLHEEEKLLLLDNVINKSENTQRLVILLVFGDVFVDGSFVCLRTITMKLYSPTLAISATS